MSCKAPQDVLGRSDDLTGLKPANILLLPSDTDQIVMEDPSEDPCVLYEFPKAIPPDRLPVPPVKSTLLSIGKGRPGQGTELHWVIADLGHGALIRC